MSDETKNNGRPLIYAVQENAMDNYNARMTAWHARMARKKGDGNLSEGVRRFIEQGVLYDKKPTE